MNKNDEFELMITDLSDDGAGIGRTSEAGPAENGTGFIWFVKDTMIGDRVIASAMKIKKNYGFARLVRILEPSADRVEPRCLEARRCGGCQIQQTDYAAQLSFKENKVLNDLVRIGGFHPDSFVMSEKECFHQENAEVSCSSPVRETAAEERHPSEPDRPSCGLISFEPIIGMEDPWRYRNKAVYPVGRDRDGKLIAGFYAGRTHSIISCSDCMLGARKNAAILKIVLEFMEEYRIEPYDETAHRGTVRHVLIREGRRTGELMVSLVINADSLRKAEVLGERLQSAFPALRSFTLCINKERTNVIMGTRLVGVRGPGYIEDEICEIGAGPAKDLPPVRFRISPLSFFQVNPVQMERLYSTALEFAGLTGTETVWDLYCGVGTISLFLARHAKKVYGVEIIPAAIENAKENATLNNIDNAEFYVGRAEEVLPAWYEGRMEAGTVSSAQKAGNADGSAGKQQGVHGQAERSQVDVIVVDPPRKGCDIRCLETMAAIRPSRIVYVSCDPATLARDLRYLCDHGYELKRVRPCDMFPHTVHIETIVLLQKLNS